MQKPSGDKTGIGFDACSSLHTNLTTSLAPLINKDVKAVVFVPCQEKVSRPSLGFKGKSLAKIEVLKNTQIQKVETKTHPIRVWRLKSSKKPRSNFKPKIQQPKRRSQNKKKTQRKSESLPRNGTRRMYPSDSDWLLSSKPWTKSRFSAFHRLKQQFASTVRTNVKHFKKPNALKNFASIPYECNSFNGYRSLYNQSMMSKWYGYLKPSNFLF